MLLEPKLVIFAPRCEYQPPIWSQKVGESFQKVRESFSNPNSSSSRLGDCQLRTCTQTRVIDLRSHRFDETKHCEVEVPHTVLYKLMLLEPKLVIFAPRLNPFESFPFRERCHAASSLPACMLGRIRDRALVLYELMLLEPKLVIFAPRCLPARLTQLCLTLSSHC